MTVLFVVRDPEAMYGIMALSAYVKAHGHDADLLVTPDGKGLGERLKRQDVGLVALSATTGRHLWALDVAKTVKACGDIPVILGGPHATYFPDMVTHPAVDAVCVGEGEGALADCLDALDRKATLLEIANLGVHHADEVWIAPPRPLIEDLDSLPFVDRGLYHRIPVALAFQQDTCIMMSGRGCPFNCSFCYNGASKEIYRGRGRYVRRRSVDHVITEMRLLKERDGIRRFVFDDDTFSWDVDWLEEFADQSSRLVKRPFICNVRADTVDERVARALSRAGCTGVKMGVETGDEGLRREILNKPISNESILRAGRILHDAGIDLQTFNMLGIPGGSLMTDLETVRLNQVLKPEHAWCSLLAPYPGTAIRARAAELGLLEEKTWAGEFERESYFVHTPLKLQDKRAVIALHHLFEVAVHFPSLFPIIQRLIHWPLGPLGEIFFKVQHALSLKRFYRIRLLTWIRFLWACRGIY